MKSSEPINYKESFPHGEFSSNHMQKLIETNKSKDKENEPKSENKKLLAGLDSEYTRKNDNENTCISWQTSTINMENAEHNSSIKYVDYKNEERLTLEDVLFFIFSVAGVKKSQINGYHVILIAHFFTAEFAMLKNRKAIFPHLEILYKTLITFNPINLTFKDEDGISYNITLEIADTMLLLPPTHRSLAKATSLLDEKYYKKDLSILEKQNMLKLLLEDKNKFEEYAIHDAVITLMLFIKLQYILNTINGTTSTRYKTIGSATVKHYKSYIKNNFPKGFFDSQFSNKNEIYQKGLNLAKRAYMGGLNTSFFIGECEGELILDIDFSSAYPCIMGLIKEGEYGEKIKFEDNKPLKEISSFGDNND